MSVTRINGSTALENTRHEAFAAHVAKGRSQLESWCMATNSEPSQGRTVTASNLVKRPEIAARIGYLKRARAESEAAAIADAGPISAGRLDALMADVTSSLMRAAQAATQRGHNAESQALRRLLTVHAGRGQRVSNRTKDAARKKSETSLQAIDIIRQIQPCRCGNPEPYEAGEE